jgi:cytochrome c oxidase subunit 2
MLEPHGLHAGQIAGLWWLMLIVCSIVLVVVCALVVVAVLRGRKNPDEEATLTKGQKRGLVLAGGVIAPAVVLIGFLIYSVVLSRAIASEPVGAIHVDVVGHQWWWGVTYVGGERTGSTFETANEIHIPVGRPVSISLTSRDVIHSFWAPNLHGKTDAIPGRKTRTWLQADTPGTWRGQCAEFCGLQHAHMAFTVTAHQPAEFERWRSAQLEAAQEPSSAQAMRGRDVFLNGPCVLCHTVRGTLALSSFGPDLTHVGSRKTLAAGTLPNTRGHLAGWILDPQAIKPGTRMPPTNLNSEDLQALLAYLEGLK